AGLLSENTLLFKPIASPNIVVKQNHFQPVKTVNDLPVRSPPYLKLGSRLKTIFSMLRMTKFFSEIGGGWVRVECQVGSRLQHKLILKVPFARYKAHLFIFLSKYLLLLSTTIIIRTIKMCKSITKMCIKALYIYVLYNLPVCF